MKTAIVYYSLSGNIKSIAQKLHELLGADLVELKTKRPMPKSFAMQILVGGFMAGAKKKAKLLPLEVDLKSYDKIILGTPIWNSASVPAINTILADKEIAQKVTAFFTCSMDPKPEYNNGIVSRIENAKIFASFIDEKMDKENKNEKEFSLFLEALKM